MKLFLKNTILFAITLISGCSPQPNTTNDNTFTILCTTFPIYQFTRNITRNVPNTKTQLLLAAQTGCPHDYALTPQDMYKLAQADVLVVNGLGLEEFLGTPVKKANSKLQILNSSNGITELISDTDNEAEHQCGHTCTAHSSAATNPHLFASPQMAVKIVRNISRMLAQKDVDNAQQYLNNSKEYEGKLLELSKKFSSCSQQIKNNKMIQPHGIFDYLARELGLNIVAVLQPHGQEPSVAEMMNLVKLIHDQKPAAIFADPQYPQKVAKTLNRETGIGVYTLDSTASGPTDASLDHYEKVMINNLNIIKDALVK